MTGGPAQPDGAVVLADERPNGLAAMLAGLLEANLARHPERAGLLGAPAVVEVEATDADVAVVVRLGHGRAEISSGPAGPNAHLRIAASGADLLDLSAAPLVLGVPNPLRRAGLEALVRVARRRVRISGMLRHAGVLSRFARLLSVR